MYEVGEPIPEREEMRRGPRPLKIGLEIPCARCGYVLAGLKTSGKCPECGAPIVVSVYGDRLEYASPGYVRKLWIGGVMGTAAVGIMLALVLVVGVPMVVCAVVMRNGMPMWVPVVLSAVFVAAPGLAWVVGLCAWWLMTSPDPAMVGRSEDPRSRRALRVVIVAEGVCWVVLFGLAMGGVVGSVPPAVYLPLATVSGVAGPCALLAHLLLASAYVRAMGARMKGITVEELCVGHTVGAWACAGLMGVCTLGVMARSEAVVLVGIPLTFLVVCVQAWIHIGVMGFVRVSAREAREKCKVQTAKCK